MKVFLFDPTCLPYRINVYKYFIEQFRKEGISLTIFYDFKLKSLDINGFKGIEYSFSSFYNIHVNEKPDVSIFFIWLRYKFSLPFLIFCRLFLPVKSIVWSKGINIANINQPIKNIFYHLRQYAADALILYSNYEKQFVKTNSKKVFVANNTINQHLYDIKNESGACLRKKYNIKEDKVVLFVGRVQDRKRVDLLIGIFSKDIRNHALLIAGPGLPRELEKLSEQASNIYYLGPIYDIKTISEIYSLSYIFCIPGEIGLGLNEAFLYGLPVVTTYIRPTSEMKLLFSVNENGLLFEKGNKEDLKDKLLLLLEDHETYNRLSKNAKWSFEQNAKIEYMYEGFMRSIKYVLHK